MNPTLSSQMNQLGLTDQQAPDIEIWRKFLTIIDHTYQKTEDERNVLERVLFISSNEVHEIYLRQKLTSDARLKTLFHAIHDLIWIKDADGVYLACNPMFERYIGAKESEIIGKTDYDFVDKEFADYSRKHDRIAIAQAAPCFNERKVVFADDGHEAWMETVKTPIYDDTGKIIGVLGIARDITARKQNEDEIKRAHDNLAVLLHRNQVLMKTANDGIHVMDIEGNVLEANDKFCQMLGYTDEEIVKLNAADWDAQWSAEELKKQFSNFIGERALFETVHRHKDGHLLNVEISATGVELDGMPYIFAASRDITERKRTEEELRTAAVTFEMHEAIIITDERANIIRVNQAFTDITGYSADEVLGKNPRFLSSGRQDDAFYKRMWQQLLSVGAWSGEIVDRRKNGQIYPKWMNITAVKNSQQLVTRYVATFSDITLRKQIEDEIRNLAFYDELTRLPNRRFFIERFRAALLDSARNNAFGAVLFLDMDRFKILNDTMGHEYGDLMLMEVATRIKSCIREMDIVARLGGDEFVVLIKEISPVEFDASRKVGYVAEKIRAMLSEPYLIKGHEHHSSPSIGISLYRGNRKSVDELLQQADTAMYQAKNEGRNAVRFFDGILQDNVVEHASLINDLNHAIERQELQLHFQMQVDNHSHITGAECLLRWQHPQHGMMLPNQFLPIAEEGTQILEIDQWVLEAACQQLYSWQLSKKTYDLSLSVNISAKQFSQPDFVNKVSNILKMHKIDSSRLRLELNGRLFLNNFDAAAEKLYALKSLGIHLAIDEFGRGCFSLPFFKGQPIDQIKIDQAFMRDIKVDGHARDIVRTMSVIAQNMQLSIIAVGVETDAQLNILAANGCNNYQGYLFSKPLPLSEFESALEKNGL